MDESASKPVLSADGYCYHGNKYEHWALIKGRPHRREIGEFTLRWSLVRAKNEESKSLLVSGPSDRPFRAFLENAGVTWFEDNDLFSFEHGSDVSYSESLDVSIPLLDEENSLQDDIIRLGSVLLEKDMEYFLAAYPDRLSELLGERVVLHPSMRQVRINKGRLDLLAADMGNRPCVIECKRGGMRRGHIGQIAEYFRPEDTLLGGARHILMVNSASHLWDAPLKRFGIEICRFPLNKLVDGIIKDGTQIAQAMNIKSERVRKACDKDPSFMNEWKAVFMHGLEEILPDDIFCQLRIDPLYKPSKKVRVSMEDDDLTILYVGSNGNWLEFGLPVLHNMLIKGVKVPIRGSGTQVFFSKGGKVPNIAVQIKADDALAWLQDNASIFAEAIEKYDEGLTDEIKRNLLLHYGAVFQDNNPLKGQADGVCRAGQDCIYCKHVQQA